MNVGKLKGPEKCYKLQEYKIVGLLYCNMSRAALQLPTMCNYCLRFCGEKQ
jgi:hypothetical protein